jgi:hypothetical protein
MAQHILQAIQQQRKPSPSRGSPIKKVLANRQLTKGK